MKIDNKEEAKRLAIERYGNDQFKYSQQREGFIEGVLMREQLVYDVLRKNKLPLKKREDVINDLFCIDSNEDRWHPETFERVEKPEGRNFKTGGEYENAKLKYDKYLTLDQLIERCKEMREGLVEIDSYDLEDVGKPYMMERELVRQHDYIGDWVKREDVMNLLK